MAYNNGFPINYPQYYNPQYTAPMTQMPQTPQPQTYQAQPGGGIIWVQGEAGAKSYLVAPNTTVQLWDSENQVIYLKSADASGMPSIKTLDYTIREIPQNPTAPSAQMPELTSYATKEELQAFEEKIQKQIEKLTARKGKESKDESAI